MKRLVIPLASYLAVTIVVPVLNGAPVNAPFLEHAALVVTLTLTITGSLSLLLRPQRFVLIGSRGPRTRRQRQKSHLVWMRPSV